MPEDNAQILVTAEWLLQRLNDKSIRIFDMRSPMEYLSGHLPNAVLVPYEGIVDFELNKPYLDVAPKERIERLLSEKGVSNGTRIVIYGDKGGASAARLLWTLEIYGANVSLLDIPYRMWMAKGYPTTREVFRPEPSRFIADSRARDLRVSSDYVASRIGKPDTVLVDTRSSEEFEGLVASSPRPGRIPGSLNLPWEEGVGGIEKIFKEKEDLVRLFEGKGITEDKEVVCYCHTGDRASHTFLAFRLCGYPNVKIYDRSYSEWGNKFELPVER